MGVPSPGDLLNFLSAGGTLAFAVLVIYGFLTERIVPRGRLDDERTQKKEAMDLARSAIAAMERSSDAIEARNKLEEERLRLEAMKR